MNVFNGYFRTVRVSFDISSEGDGSCGLTLQWNPVSKGYSKVLFDNHINEETVRKIIHMQDKEAVPEIKIDKQNRLIYAQFKFNTLTNCTKLEYIWWICQAVNNFYELITAEEKEAIKAEAAKAQHENDESTANAEVNEKTDAQQSVRESASTEQNAEEASKTE